MEKVEVFKKKEKEAVVDLHVSNKENGKFKKRFWVCFGEEEIFDEFKYLMYFEKKLNVLCKKRRRDSILIPFFLSTCFFFVGFEFGCFLLLLLF